MCKYLDGLGVLQALMDVKSYPLLYSTCVDEHWP